MNKAFLIGRLTAEPELRTTPNGVSVCTLRIAVNRRFQRDVTDFFTVIAWRAMGENCAKYLVKGQQVAVVGEIQIRTYEKDGVKRYITEIQADDVEFLAKPSGSASGDKGAASQRVPPPEKDDEPFEMSGVLMEDEELPF